MYVTIRNIEVLAFNLNSIEVAVEFEIQKCKIYEFTTFLERIF